MTLSQHAEGAHSRWRREGEREGGRLDLGRISFIIEEEIDRKKTVRSQAKLLKAKSLSF